MHAPNRPVSLILDTDMGNDIDDALALAMIHTLQTQGECRLLGVAISKANRYAAAYVDAVNTFYGRDGLPIGLVRGGVTPEDGAFIRQIVTADDAAGGRLFPVSAPTPDYPEAVDLLRRLLSRAEDHSVTVVMIGFSTNMARLLASGPDGHSKLDGRALFGAKVRRVVMMAADFSAEALRDPAGQKPEYNVRNDVASAQAFVAGCPSPIVFCGWEIGQRVMYPGSSMEDDFGWAEAHPVADAYRLYQPMPYDRPSWDQTAVLEAVRPSQGYFGLSQPGRVAFADDGRVSFSPELDGPHRYLTVTESQAKRALDDVVHLCRQPVEPVLVEWARANAVAR